MSDSVKKYYELLEDGLIGPDFDPEKDREMKIMTLLANATKAGKIAEVELRAEEVRREFKSTSLLLGLEIACDELL